MAQSKQRTSVKELTLNDSKVIGTITQRRREKAVPPDKFHSRKFKTLTSAWTPLVSKPTNMQICQDRTELIVNWFGLWTDRQRKYFLDRLFRHCMRAQLFFIQNWFRERVPLRHLDFTTVLPRFLSLYVFKFLDPRSLCRAAIVSWNWNFLTSQDEVWSAKCRRRGWYLPYTPEDHEYGACKRHYVACIQTLDMNVVAKDPSGVYGTKGDGSKVRKPTAKGNRLSLEQSFEVLHSRPPWQPPDKTPRDMERSCKSLFEDQNPNDPVTHSSLSIHHNQFGIVKTGLVRRSEDFGLNTKGRHKQHRILEAEDDPDLQPRQRISLSRSLELSSFEDRRLTELAQMPWEPPKTNKLPGQTKPNLSGVGGYLGKNGAGQQPISKSFPNQPNPRVVFISSRVPGAEVLVDAVNFGVIPIVYEYEGTTLDALLSQLESCLAGRSAQSLGVFVHSEYPWEMRLVHGSIITSDNIELPEFVEFFESLSSHVLPAAQKGHVDFFVPLASCEQGEALMQQLTLMTGLKYSAPTGIIGNYNHVNTDWSSNPEGVPPPQHYFCASKMNVWANTADQVQEACQVTKKLVTTFFEQKQKDVVSQLVGQIVFDVTGQTDLEGIQEIGSVLVDGLVNMGHEQNRTDNEGCLASRKPLEYLAGFLLEKSDSLFGQTKADGVRSGYRRDTLALDEKYDESLQNSEYTDEYDSEVAQINSKGRKQQKNKQILDDGDSDTIQEDISEDISADEGGIDSPDQFAKRKPAPKPKTSYSLPNTSRSKDLTLRRTRDIQPQTSKTQKLLTGQTPRRLTSDQLKSSPEKRSAVAHEILSSEVEYMRTLEILETVFVQQLRAALASNQAILGEHNLQIIFSDAITLLDLSRGLTADIKGRVTDWGPQQCLGDIFLKFSVNFKAYSNFLKNYPTILTTIERSTENSPAFRAYLKRTERTPATKMLRLAELLLIPTRRINEYTTLMTWLQNYTPKDHADRADLKSAIRAFADFEDHIRDCKRRSEHERELIALQKTIVKCPVLLEANRFLVKHEDMASLKAPPPNSRVHQHVGDLGMFLFNDGLVVTQRITRHTPFQYAREYKYVFSACVDLIRLRVHDVPDTKYLRNAFRLSTPSREWICQTEDLDTKLNWITLVKNTVIAALEDAD